MISLAATLSSALLLASSVTSHGMFVHPGPISEALKGPGVRNYGAINTAVSSLRAPNSAGLCRGASKGKVTDISLKNGEQFTVTLAFSIGAQHVGPCAIEIIDADNMGAPGVEIASVAGPNGCARPGIAGFDTDKASSASQQCPKGLPPNLITDDMCLSEWSFTVKNADKIKCTNCVLHWTWTGNHVSTPEFYDNCADVRISSSGGSNVNAGMKTQSENGPVPGPSKQPENKESSYDVPSKLSGEYKDEKKEDKKEYKTEVVKEHDSYQTTQPDASTDSEPTSESGEYEKSKGHEGEGEEKQNYEPDNKTESLEKTSGDYSTSEEKPQDVPAKKRCRRKQLPAAAPVL